jgi:hypothetical protein
MTPAEEELKKLQAERDKLYWYFTRCARAKPVPSTLIRRICELEKQVHREREAANKLSE